MSLTKKGSNDCDGSSSCPTLICQKIEKRNFTNKRFNVSNSPWSWSCPSRSWIKRNSKIIVLIFFSEIIYL